MAILTLLLGPLLAGLAYSALGDDISNTYHNLVRVDGAGTEAEETCVFCHTPRGQPADGAASRSGDVGLPGWQQSLPGEYTYPAAEPVASQVMQNSGPNAGPNSLICLSCHDSGQAPYTGGMRHNHPVGVPFRGWKRSDASGNISQNDPPMDLRGWVMPKTPGTGSDYFQPLASGAPKDSGYLPSEATLISDNLVWWVSTTGSTRRQRSDLPLYGRAGADGERIPFIECASCHDPHSTNRMFLRLSDLNGRNSKLCMSCHNM